MSGLNAGGVGGRLALGGALILCSNLRPDFSFEVLIGARPQTADPISVSNLGADVVFKIVT